MKYRYFPKVLLPAALVLALTASCARAQDNAVDAGLADIEFVAGAQVPPTNAPLWGDARLDIPSQNAPLPKPDAGGQTIYVAPQRENGGHSEKGVYALETNAGATPDAPTTVARAIEMAPAASVIVFRGGTYRGVGDLTINKKLSLQNAPGEKPWLLGTQRIASEAFASAGAGFAAQTYVAPFQGDLGVNESTQILDKRPQLDQSKNAVATRYNLLLVDGKMLREVAPFSWDYTDKTRGAQKGERTAQEQLTPPDGEADDSRAPNGTFWVDKAGGKVYVNVGAPLGGKTVEAARFLRAFMFDKEWDGATMRGLGMAFYGRDGARSFLGTPQEISRCAFVWNGEGGFSINVPLSPAVIRDNVFACNGMVGMDYSYGREGTLIAGNRFGWNNVKQYAQDWAAAGVKITSTHDMIARGNTVEGNYATGLWMDVDVLRPRVYDNTARYNGSIGIFFEISDGATIAYNQSYGNGFAGVMLSNSTNSTVWNNTLVRNGANLVLKNSHRKNNDKRDRVIAGIPIGSYFSAANNSFGNNLLVDLRAGRSDAMFRAAAAGVDRELSATMVKFSDGNAFVRTATDAKKMRPPILDWSWSFDVPAKKIDGANYASLDAFRNDPRYKKLGENRESRSLELVGPQRLFANDSGAAPDLRLVAGAAVLGKGVAQPPIVAAIAKELGRASDPPNIGAFDVAAKRTDNKRTGPRMVP